MAPKAKATEKKTKEDKKTKAEEEKKAKTVEKPKKVKETKSKKEEKPKKEEKKVEKAEKPKKEEKPKRTTTKKEEKPKKEVKKVVKKTVAPKKNVTKKPLKAEKPKKVVKKAIKKAETTKKVKKAVTKKITTKKIVKKVDKADIPKSQAWVIEAIQVQRSDDKQWVSKGKIKKYIYEYIEEAKAGQISRLVKIAVQKLTENKVLKQKKDSFAIAKKGQKYLKESTPSRKLVRKTPEKVVVEEDKPSVEIKITNSGRLVRQLVH